MTEEKQKQHFTEDDEKKYVDALNFFALEARYGDGAPKLEYILKVQRHFAFLQSLVPKISDNIFEIKKLHKPAKK